MTQLTLFELFNEQNKSQIEQLKSQLEALELKASVQDIAISRWKTVLTNAEEALKDIASVFEDSQVLTNAKDDIADMVERVAQSHEQYFMTSRISSKTVREEQKQKEVIMPVLEAVELPDSNDNQVILSQKQIEIILGSLSPEELNDFTDKNGIRAGNLNSIAKNLANRNLTYFNLSMLINLVKPMLKAV